MRPSLPVLPTGLVGSWPQPEWLIRRAELTRILPVRTRRQELWRPSPDVLDDALDDAVDLAVLDQTRAGVDIGTDGEVRRESYSNHFANALEGIDHARPGEAIDRTGASVAVPRVVAPIVRRHPVEVDAVRFLRNRTGKPIKVTVPGPFTMAQQAQDDFYGDREALALAYAAAVNDEVLDLFAAGADFVQLDEPYLEARPDDARAYALTAIDRAVADAPGPTVLHICFGYGIHVADKESRYRFLEELAACRITDVSIEAAQPHLDLAVLRDLGDKIVHLGVIDLRDRTVETPAAVADRLRDALTHLPPERLAVAPDCGLKYLPRSTAMAKLTAIVTGTAIVRSELGLDPAYSLTS